MKNFRLIKCYTTLLVAGILSLFVQLQAIERDETSVSTEEFHEMLENSDMKYVYLGKECSDLHEVISRISELEDSQDSLLSELQKHIEEGFAVGLYDSVVEALSYAEKALEANILKINPEEAHDIARSLEMVTDQVINEALTINTKRMNSDSAHMNTSQNSVVFLKSGPNCQGACKPNCRGCKARIDIRNRLKVHCKAEFKKDVTFEDKVEFEHYAKFDGNAKFKEDVTIEETLTVTDLVVLSCIDNLCVTNLTVIDIIVPGSCLSQLCVNTLSVTDLVVLSCMDSLCVNDLSVNELTVASCVDNLCVTNLSVTDLAVASCIDSLCVNTLSVTELVVTGLTVIGCIADLCVIDLSVVDETVSGTLSVNNEVVANLTVTNCMTSLCVNDLSVVDEAVSGTLSVNNEVVANLTVTNCMTSLCVEDLSVVDESVSGTLSVNNAFINNLSVNDVVIVGCIANACVIDLSVVDESVSGTLSVADLVVIDCIDNLCVIDLSAVDVTITGTLSVTEVVTASLSTCDVIVGCDILMNNTSGPAIGNILKAGISFLHNAGTDNTFLGINAGNFTTTGAENVGVGRQALFSNTTGDENVAIGGFALPINTIGANDIAVGAFSLASNTTGNENTALGGFTLTTNTSGSGNTAVGYQAGFSLATGNNNVFVGNNAALFAATGFTNVIIGYNAGLSLTNGDDNIYISNAGVASEDGIIRIGTVATHTSTFVQGIFGSVVGGTGIEVFVDAAGQLGTVVSSRRFKHDIADMNSDISDNIYNLRPVTFVYNSDESDTLQYGLIAEEVDQVLPELVVHDEEGAPYTVRYHLLPMLLLNEVQKLNGIIQDQAVTINALKLDNKKFGEMIDVVLARINRLNLQ